MARDKFSYDEDNFRLVTVKQGHPAYVAAGDSAKTITITVPTGAVWKLVHGVSFFTTSATVGARIIQIQATDNGGSNTTYFRNTTITLAASTVQYANFYNGGADSALSNNTQDCSVPPFIMDGGSKLIIKFAVGVDAADTHVFTGIFRELA